MIRLDVMITSSQQYAAYCDSLARYFDPAGLRTRPKGWKHPLVQVMNAYADAHPEESTFSLKAQGYERFAEAFEPYLFREAPFFWADASSLTCNGGDAPGVWLLHRNLHLYRDVNPERMARYEACDWHGIHLGYVLHDHYHHAVPHKRILENGLSAFYREAETELKSCADEHQRDFLRSVLRGLLAVKRAAERFAEKAEEMLLSETEPAYRRNLERIAAAARKVPWNRPETFYEALACIMFCRSMLQIFEGVSMGGNYGMLDRMLAPFYERDLAAGRITEKEAEELLVQAMLPPHISAKTETFGKGDVRSWHDTYDRGDKGSSLFLGGYDANHQTVCNAITMLVLDIHHTFKMQFPKLAVRITKDSPDHYLKAIAADYLAGRNVMAIYNDETIIAANMKAGKRFEDACDYVNSTCWELVLEGSEHSAGANCYFNLVRTLDLCINDDPDTLRDTGCKPEKFDGASSYEEVYRRYMTFTIRELREMCGVIGTHGRAFPQVSPGPVFSACLKDCIRNHKDYSEGGARYSPHGMPMFALANTVDSLLAIKTLCFDRKLCTLDRLLQAIRSDWSDEGGEVLRQAALQAPHYGDGSRESAELAKRILDELIDAVKDLRNERGGPFQPGLYSSWEFFKWGKMTGATPDGRHRGDILANGMSTSRLRDKQGITEAMNLLPVLDLTRLSANASLDITLPLGSITEEILCGLIRTFSALGGMQLQMNCVSRKLLEDAIAHPENHHDLFVRIYGLSVRFITLPDEWKREIMSRPEYR